MIVKNINEYIGNTPLVKIPNPRGNQVADVYVKLEEFNPGGSIKTRVAFQMIADAEKEGVLKPGSNQVIIEPTGGHTGIGLAIAGAISGYKVVLVVPDNFSKEKIQILKAYGAKVILSDHKTGNNSHIKKAQEIIQSNPQYICLDQFKNISNPKAHYRGTGEEIVKDFRRANRKIDAFVTAIGSGGTLSGAGRKIKEEYKDALIVGVQPEGCDILNKKFVPHRIQAIAVGVVTPFLDKELIDKMCSIRFEEAVYWMKYLANNRGLLVGISSGANIAAAMKIAEELGNNKNIVTPDSGRSYLGIWVGEGENDEKDSQIIL